MNSFDVVRVSTGSSPGGTTIQTESATLGGGAALENTSTGFHGTAYVNFPATGGTLTFNNIDGGAGGTKILSFRFSNGGTAARAGSLVINGTAQNISFPTTADWNTWAVVNVSVILQSGMTNTVQVRSTGQDLANLDELLVP